MSIDALSKNLEPATSFDAINSNNTDSEQLPEHLAVVEQKHHEEVNIRLLLVNAMLKIEGAKKNEIHVQNGELAKLKDRLHTITTFVEHVGNQLSNPRNKDVNLAQESQLVEKMKEIFPHEYLSRTSWTRDEAEKLCVVFTRRSDRITNDINDMAVQINRKFEDWHELVPIWKEMLKSLNDAIDRMNQRARAG